MSVAKQSSLYTVDLPAFAGPLDLLLYLIDHEELDITTISLVQVTEQYLMQIEHLKQDRMEELIDFLVIGAKLVLIKSRALLPQEPSLPSEEDEEEDPAEALIRQLQQYRRFKSAAEELRHREEQGLRTYLRVVQYPKPQGQLDLSGVSSESLLRAVQNALARAEDLEESVSLVRPRRITIDSQIKKLRYHLRSGSKVRFNELLSTRSSRLEIAVTLLALLELIKRREAVAVQESTFGPISINAVVDHNNTH
ncbi:MAG: segregation/condensation protein A [Candidatus Promineifilaceae bacterium]|nr:segregation/condensation protein A [Candidatus Promineifilaceae bacterium]